ncbi:MAG: prepilin-type N-terminal cleavage/methylation domain-containing protein [Verrucomicrobiota bacterium]
MQRRGVGFTLIEVLVVIAVLSLMAALILPVLGRSKLSARRIKCASNLRQIGIATQMYWDDNAGYTFRYRGISTNGGDLYWFGWLERGVEGKRAFDPRPGALYSYLGSRGVEMCPSLDYAFRQFKLKALGAAYGYGYNLCLSPPLQEPPLNLDRVKHPSDCSVFADAAQVNTFQPPASPQNPLLEEFYFVSTNEATAHFRHRQTANVVFCDGHVGSERPLIGSLDARLPSQRVGRLPTEILMVP